jgi:hypothetical protein
MRAVVFLVLALALATTAQADMRQETGNIHAHVQRHRLHRTMHAVISLDNGFYDVDAVPDVEGSAPLPVVMPPPPPPYRICNDRPTVEHTEFGVTIIRGPGSCR